jgi:putative tricarboxylic transport membrane protein
MVQNDAISTMAVCPIFWRRFRGVVETQKGKTILLLLAYITDRIGTRRAKATRGAVPSQVFDCIYYSGDRVMKASVFVEGMIFSASGFIGLYEGMRLAGIKELNAVQDPLGSDGYLMMIGLALIIAGATHILINYKKDSSKKKVMVSEEEKGTLKMAVKIFASLVVYCLLINFIGYLYSSLVFFVLVLQIFAFKWYANLILSVVFSLIFYVLFEYLLNMSFPKGLLF